jgi:hypothetical protein
MPQPIVYVESEADQRLAQILLRSLPATIDNGSDAVSAATTELFFHPEQPVAVLLGTREATPREIESRRGSIHRLIRRSGSDNYFVALAEKRLLDWVLTDPRLRQAFESSPQDMKIYNDRAARVAELARSIPFDPSHLLRQSEDYRGLVEWIHNHAAQPQAS